MPSPFYLLIPNGPRRGAPVVAHPTLELAQAEAQRLHALFKGHLMVRILETHSDVESVHREHGPQIVIKRKRSIQVPMSSA